MRNSLLAIMFLTLAGCTQPDVQSAAELNAIYERALRDTDDLAVRYDAGSNAETRILNRLQDYFADMSAESVARDTEQVYAPDALLYDNVVALRGRQVIQDYFAKAAADVDELRVEFLQVARAGSDYYVRWRMTIVSDRLADGEPMASYGVTQFRFDQDGAVLLHRDFWDASTGLYEYLPVAGNWFQRIRGMLGGHADS